MKNKFEEFLEITKRLNEENITPLLMGSLGLEYVTKKDWSARDIDIHVYGDPRGWEAPDEERIYEWDKITKLMNNLGYVLVDLHEHEFTKNSFSVEYGVMDTLEAFANVTESELDYHCVTDSEFYTPSLQAFLKIYSASSLDGYRNEKNDSKDLDKINYLNELLQK